MKKTTNLLNFYNLFKISENLIKECSIKNYLKIESLKECEILSLFSLCQKLQESSHANFYLFENFYINYQIPQIGKEFDLLKFGKDKIINIELKSQQVEENELIKQLQRNFYYLSALQRTIHCYIFLENNNQIYQYIYLKKIA